MGWRRKMMVGEMDKVWVVPSEFPPAFATGGWGEDRWGYFADLEIEGGDGKPVVQRMRWIPPGEFLMGSSAWEHEQRDIETQHAVLLTRGYWLADTACTQEFWAALMGANPSKFQDKGATRPVECVDWNACSTFLERLTGMFVGLEFALPTEAQWEYACRAGTTTPFWFGETITTDQVNFDGNHSYLPGDRKGDYIRKTVPVKSFSPNGWGLYEMHGNVWEWCADWFGAYETDGVEPLRDPEGPPSGDYRVVRGGGWFSDARYCRSAYRSWRRPDYQSNVLGFRFAQVGGAG